MKVDADRKIEIPPEGVMLDGTFEEEMATLKRLLGLKPEQSFSDLELDEEE